MNARSVDEWKITRLSPALGARVDGVDLRAMTLAAWDRLDELFTEHLVLVLPDQHVTPVEQVEIGAHFGVPFIHPFLEAVPEHPAILQVLKEPHETATFGGEFWHCDISFEDPPAAVSLLYGLEIPEMGGDTLFANQHLAFETLSQPMQEFLSTLDAPHIYPDMNRGDPGASALHPVVRVHPVTGRRSLFVNRAFVSSIDGLEQFESRALLDFLFTHQIRPEFTTRVRWEPNQLTIWDNRSTLHYAMNDYAGERRRLQRVTVIEPAR